MMWSNAVALGSLALVLHARSVLGSSMKPTPGIDWFACSQAADNVTTCGTLQIPLDYTAPTCNESLALHLVKISATTQPSKGSILFDFGGPGSINVDYFIGDTAQALLLMTGGVYDLVTFEPRGLGTTLPYSCYNSSAARAAAIATTPQALDGSNKTIEAAWAAAEALSEACHENAAGAGELVGTAFVARDMMQIVDALKEDGLLNYYGFSYGTTLGATVAAMFPDRMGKLVLDGVWNPADYWAGPSTSFLLDTDAAFSAFFTACIESPQLCALARMDSSAGDLSRRIAGLLEELKSSPLVLGADNSTVTVTYGSLKAAIVSALYFPVAWSGLADGLAAVLSGNFSAYAAAGAGAAKLFPPSLFLDLSGPEVQTGIQCADGALRSDDLTDLLPILAQMERTSWIRGDVDVAISLLQCSRWKFSSKERYTGTFNDIKTKHPVLVIGNAIDPTTPLVSARNLSEGLKGSVLLQNNGYGHTTQASPSLCIAQHVRAYFVDGTLPTAGTVCESVTSTQPFAFDGSYYEAISGLGNVTKRSIGGEAEVDDDVALFKAVKDFSKGFAQRKLGTHAR